MNQKLPKPYWQGIFLLGCLILSAIAYHGVWTADFIGLDDPLYVSQNRIVQMGLTRTGFRWALTATHASTWQPLVWISYMLDVSLQGMNPAGFHLTNLLLHLLTVVLVFLVTRKISRSPVAAGIATLLFALHPVHVETVAWVSERKGLISTFFACLAILAYTQYTETQKLRYYCSTFGCMAFGLMAKPMVLTLPFIFLLLDIWPLRRAKTWHGLIANNAKLLTEKMPFLLLTLGSVIITSYTQWKGGSFLGFDIIPLSSRIANAAISLWRYLWHLVYPVRLSVLYPHPVHWPWWMGLSALLALSGFIYLLWIHKGRFPWVVWGFAWFFISLLPVLGITQFGWHAMADRFLYLPAMGIYLAAGMTLAPAWQRKPATVVISIIVLAGILLWQTQRQTRYWQNSITLFTRAVAVTRNNWIMHNSLGAAWSHAGRYAEANQHFEKALAIKPDNPKALFNLGHVRFVQQRWDDAAALFEQSLALESNYQARFNLAVTHTRRGALREARETYLNLLESHPQHIPALLNLGKLYRDEEKYAQALACYRMVKRLDPANQQARTGIAIAMLATADDPMPAIAELISLLDEDPGNADAREALNRAIHGNPQYF